MCLWRFCATHAFDLLPPFAVRSLCPQSGTLWMCACIVGDLFGYSSPSSSSCECVVSPFKQNAQCASSWWHTFHSPLSGRRWRLIYAEMPQRKATDPPRSGGKTMERCWCEADERQIRHTLTCTHRIGVFARLPYAKRKVNHFVCLIDWGWKSTVVFRTVVVNRIWLSSTISGCTRLMEINRSGRIYLVERMEYSRYWELATTMGASSLLVTHMNSIIIAITTSSRHIQTRFCQQPFVSYAIPNRAGWSSWLMCSFLCVRCYRS